MKRGLTSPGIAHSPSSSPSQSTPSSDLRQQLSSMLLTLHTQQSTLQQVTKENLAREAQLSLLERDLVVLKREQQEADALIASLVDIFTSVRETGEDIDLKTEHPVLYSRLRGFRLRLETFLEKKRE